MDTVYIYDGSFDGWLCSVFESFQRKELPAEIVSRDGYSPTLFAVREIFTDSGRAQRVANGIRANISAEAYDWVSDGFDTCHPQKERLMLDFLRLGFASGANVTSRLTDPTVSTLYKAVSALYSEAHRLKGFVRFSVYNGAMAAVIEPKNRVLRLLARHFADRYPAETFLIYDKTHREALVYKPREWRIFPAEYTLPPPDDEERYYRELWRLFHRTVAVEGRENPVCQRSHMPKRFWAQLTEMTEDAAETKKLLENFKKPLDKY